MPDMSVMCDRDSHMLLCVPGMWGAIDLYRRFCIHISSDDDGDNQRPNVSGDARRAQDEANHGAAAQEEDDEAENVPEHDNVDTQGYTSGYMSEEEDGGWQYRDNDLASRDIINSQRMAICLDEPREAQYMAGFIALQMSKMWGMFEGGEKRTRSKGS